MNEAASPTHTALAHDRRTGGHPYGGARVGDSRGVRIVSTALCDVSCRLDALTPQGTTWWPLATCSALFVNDASICSSRSPLTSDLGIQYVHVGASHVVLGLTGDVVFFVRLRVIRTRVFGPAGDLLRDGAQVAAETKSKVDRITGQTPRERSPLMDHGTFHHMCKKNSVV